jgi:transposase-like protein
MAMQKRDAHPLNEGNIHIHSQKKRRYRCTVCRQTFTESKGTLF